MQKHLKTFALLIVIIGFSSCGSWPRNLPTKPSVDSGIVILEANEVFFVNNQTGKEESWPIVLDGQLNPKLNKTIVHSNADWNLVLLYIRLLEKYTPKRVTRELKKIRNSSYKILSLEK